MPLLDQNERIVTAESHRFTSDHQAVPYYAQFNKQSQHTAYTGHPRKVTYGIEITLLVSHLRHGL